MNLGPCPKNDPDESRTPINEGVSGLAKHLVPISATTVRVCEYQSLPTGEEAVTSGAPPLSATDFERETNALELYPQPVAGGCVAFPTDVYVTFANATQRMSLEFSFGCFGGVSNRVLDAHTTTKWLTEVKDFATVSLNKRAVTGTWRPLTVTGYAGTFASPPLAVKPELSFDGNGNWTGSDGCSHLDGTYRFGANGAASFSVISTKRACLQSTPPDPLEHATRAEIVDGRLTFFDRGGSRLAQYTLESVLPPAG